MKLYRFERKILVAIVTAAVTPLIGALVLGQAALREAYQVGVNARVRAQLEEGLVLYREHFVERRQSGEELATALADDVGLHEALVMRDHDGDRGRRLEARLRELVARHGDLSRLAVRDRRGEPLAHAQKAAPEADSRELTLSRVLNVAGAEEEHRLEATVVAPARLFSDYQRAGELAEVYGRLERGTGQVAGFYLAVYMGFLLSVIALALVAGIVLSRRVTRRVSLLAEATRRVGAGDLAVQVPHDARDEIGELTREFNEMVRDLRESRGRIEYLQRISAWQEFARRLAHEIKNPLTPIQLAIQEVHKSYKGDDAGFSRRLEDARTIIEEEVATLRRLTSEFSTFAKLPEATLAPADLNDFVRDAQRSAEGIVEEERKGGAPITLSIELDRRPLPVRIDAMMLKRCLDNLVRNAAAALHEHEAGERRVLVRTRRSDRHALLEVHDSGPGVPAHERQRIFEPYVTTKSDGTGLGLPIVKKVVLEHEGEVLCSESELGGALFRLVLPAAR